MRSSSAKRQMLASVLFGKAIVCIHGVGGIPDWKEFGLVVAGRLRDSLRSNAFCKDEGLNLNVRASIGLATYPHDAKTPHDLIRQADEMMYMVKNSTRDNIGIAQRGSGEVGLGRNPTVHGFVVPMSQKPRDMGHPIFSLSLDLGHQSSGERPGQPAQDGYRISVESTLQCSRL